MAAKKKPAYQDPSKKNRATTKDKPKSANDGRGTKAQIAALKGPTSTRKPTEAITAPGQRATGLAKSTVKGNRFSSTAKTPVYKAQQGLRGTGTPLATSLGYKPTKTNIANAALTATMLPGSGQVANWAAKKVAGRVGGATADATWNVAARGLGSISRGGKVSKTFTPMGPTLKSTRIMNPKQTSAALNALETRAMNITNAATKASMNASAKITKQVVRGASGTAKVAAGTGVAASNKKSKNKKK